MREYRVGARNKRFLALQSLSLSLYNPPSILLFASTFPLRLFVVTLVYFATFIFFFCLNKLSFKRSFKECTQCLRKKYSRRCVCAFGSDFVVNVNIIVHLYFAHTDTPTLYKLWLWHSWSYHTIEIYLHISYVILDLFMHIPDLFPDAN